MKKQGILEFAWTLLESFENDFPMKQFEIFSEEEWKWNPIFQNFNWKEFLEDEIEKRKTEFISEREIETTSKKELREIEKEIREKEKEEINKENLFSFLPQQTFLWNQWKNLYKENNPFQNHQNLYSLSSILERNFWQDAKGIFLKNQLSSFSILEREHPFRQKEKNKSKFLFQNVYDSKEKQEQKKEIPFFPAFFNPEEREQYNLEFLAGKQLEKEKQSAHIKEKELEKTLEINSILEEQIELQQPKLSEEKEEFSFFQENSILFSKEEQGQYLEEKKTPAMELYSDNFTFYFAQVTEELKQMTKLLEEKERDYPGQNITLQYDEKAAETVDIDQIITALTQKMIEERNASARRQGI